MKKKCEKCKIATLVFIRSDSKELNLSFNILCKCMMHVEIYFSNQNDFTDIHTKIPIQNIYVFTVIHGFAILHLFIIIGLVLQ